MEVPGKRLKIWCLMRDQFAHVKPVEDSLAGRADFIYDQQWDAAALVRNKPDLVVCVNDFTFEIAQCLEAARGARIPSLLFQDGILEWRCQYENPLFGSGGGAPQHQPVLADKIACLGRQSARQIAAWGNSGKAEVTGMPRLDALLNRAPKPPAHPGSRLLVMTAKKPGFTPEQTAVTVRSLQDVKAFLETAPGINVIWRLSKGLDQTLGVVNTLTDISGNELADILEQVDAVLTTPSTAILEAMLLRRPVAALDYHNTPRFVPTAWTISAREHIAQVVAEILNPPARKLAFQEDCLHDCLCCNGPAAPRAAALIEAMVSAMDGIPAGSARWQLPPRLLPGDADVSSRPAPQLHDLYPEQPSYAENNVAVLQATLARLARKNADLEKLLRRRSIRSGIYAFGRQISSYIHPRKQGRS